ncbi:MAG: hypothetical protein ABL916_17855 [Burkholderiaceae bacterium]
MDRQSTKAKLLDFAQFQFGEPMSVSLSVNYKRLAQCKPLSDHWPVADVHLPRYFSKKVLGIVSANRLAHRKLTK